MVPQVRVVYDLHLHAAVRAKRFQLFILTQKLINATSSLEVQKLLTSKFYFTFNGWDYDDFTNFKVDERVEWLYPGPDKVVCFPMEGNDNPDADWLNPIWERVPYAQFPAIGII